MTEKGAVQMAVEQSPEPMTVASLIKGIQAITDTGWDTEAEAILTTYRTVLLAEAKRELAQAIHALKQEEYATRERAERAEAAHVEMQRHRDTWRGYAYGTRPKPQDFLDSNMVDRPETALEKADAAVAQVREELKTEALVQARLRRSWDEEAVETRKAKQTLAKAIRLAKAYGEALGDKATRRVCEQFEKDEATRALSADGGK